MTYKKNSPLGRIIDDVPRFDVNIVDRGRAVSLGFILRNLYGEEIIERLRDYLTERGAEGVIDAEKVYTFIAEGLPEKATKRIDPVVVRGAVHFALRGNPRGMDIDPYAGLKTGKIPQPNALERAIITEEEKGEQFKGSVTRRIAGRAYPSAGRRWYERRKGNRNRTFL